MNFLHLPECVLKVQQAARFANFPDIHVGRKPCVVTFDFAVSPYHSDFTIRNISEPGCEVGHKLLLKFALPSAVTDVHSNFQSRLWWH